MGAVQAADVDITFTITAFHQSKKMEQPFGSLDIRIKILYNIFKFSSAAPTFLETFLQLLETSEVEFFLSALPNFSGSFPQNCFEQVFCKANLRASASVKKDLLN